MNDLVKVDNQDTLVAAVDDAMVRARNVFGHDVPTLIDTIPQEAWDKWDASGENPNVADSPSFAADDDDDDNWGAIAA